MMFTLITHFIAFCLGAWACSAVLLPAKKEGKTVKVEESRSPVKRIQAEGNPGEILNPLGSVSKQVFTDENMKQMQNLAGQLMQQLPQMIGALNAQKGEMNGLSAIKSASQNPEEATLKKQLAEINRMLGVSGITEEEVRSLLTQEHLDPEQRKILEQYLELSRIVSDRR